ncbi:hypothetical protein [Streptomyces sp. Caat 7-52]|uniref:hypothetical protein n=1 Tax=Streptomyces sp. Caat 7-52 TaxID=2949637 RepID=UPI002034D754|nr:hypothetical protein [Streptomyces sp. Caat 7-52]
MGGSMLYQVLEPLPDRASALLTARTLLDRFGEGDPDDVSLDFLQIATREQFEHARQYFAHGAFNCSEKDLRSPGIAQTWRTLRSLGFLESEPGWVDTRLEPELAALWPLPHRANFMLTRGSIPSTFPVRDSDWYTEEEIDDAVEACGPLSLDVSWSSALRGLPAAKLCGVQLCLNSSWTGTGPEPDPGVHTVYLSIGTRNPEEVALDWLGRTGLRFGQGLWGW